MGESELPVFLNVMADVLREEKEAKEKKYKDVPFRHYPSSSTMVKDDGTKVGACMRNLYWRATKEVPSDAPKGIAGEFQRGFGDAIHYWFLGKLKRAKGMVIAPETGGKILVEPLKSEISFRMDGLVLIKDQVGGIELKTTQARGLEYMVKEGGPKDHQVLQVLDYFLTNPTLTFFNIIYVARDTGYSAEYRITKEPDDFYIQQVAPYAGPKRVIEHLDSKKVLVRRKELEGHLERKTLPPRDYSVFLNKEGAIQDVKQKDGVKYKSDFWCVYCEFKSKCWTMPDAAQAAKKV